MENPCAILSNLFSYSSLALRATDNARYIRVRASLALTSSPPSFTLLLLHLLFSPAPPFLDTFTLSIMEKAVNPSTHSLEVNESTVAITTQVKDEKSGVNYSVPEKGLVSASYNTYLGDEDPTEDEMNGPNALRRISAPIPWAVYTVAFVELCERFSYYGTQVLCE